MPARRQCVTRARALTLRTLVGAGGTWRNDQLETEGSSGSTEPGAPSAPTATADAGTHGDLANGVNGAIPKLRRANCLELTREGRSKQALACFEREAQGSEL